MVAQLPVQFTPDMSGNATGRNFRDCTPPAMRVYARLERFGTGKVEQLAVAEQDAHEHRADLDVGDLVKTYLPVIV